MHKLILAFIGFFMAMGMAFAAVDLNSADQATLDSLKGIGPVKAKAIADDWCWIIDHTIQLGKTKCLLVLGIRLSEMPKGRCLKYQDLEPIDLLPVETSTGATVWQQLEKTSAKTGVPRAIVSDCGSDLKSGIAMFCARHDGCVSLYDIKHKTACRPAKSRTGQGRGLAGLHTAGRPGEKPAETDRLVPPGPPEPAQQVPLHEH